MKMKSVFLISCLFPLAACIYQPSLEERLQGKSKLEREKILEQECFQEASWRTPGRYGHSSSSHINRMKKICEEMSDEMKQQSKKSKI